MDLQSINEGAQMLGSRRVELAMLQLSNDMKSYRKKLWIEIVVCAIVLLLKHFVF